MAFVSQASQNLLTYNFLTQHRPAICAESFIIWLSAYIAGL